MSTEIFIDWRIAEKFGDAAPAAAQRLTADAIDKVVSKETHDQILARLVQCGVDRNLKGRLKDASWLTVFTLFTSIFTAATSCFHKGYTEHDDRCGGSLDAFDPCGVPVGFIPLPKQESAADAVAMYNLFMHPPNVAVGDNWCAAKQKLHSACAVRGIHLDARDGAVVDEKAADAIKKPVLPIVSVAGLAREHSHVFSARDAASDLPQMEGVQRLPHIATDSKVAAFVHDLLHGEPHKQCLNRHPHLIAECRTENSMVHEQSYSQRKKYAAFLRNYAPQRMLMVLRVVLHRLARRINLEHLETFRALVGDLHESDPQAGWHMVLNALGQVVFKCR